MFGALRPSNWILLLTSIFSTEEQGGFSGNLAYAIVAQGVGLLSSILTSLVLPKFLGVDDYAYWQLFLLYSSYSGFALFGLNDGIYLRLGGKRYSEIDHGELKAQQCVVVISQLAVALCCFVAIVLSGVEHYRGLILALCVLFGLIINLTQCLRYVFQCTNLTRISSMADLIAKGLFLLFMGTVIVLGVRASLPFILGYIVCQAVAFVYVLTCARETLSAKASFAGVLKTCLADVKAGMKIMVAYYADSLIVGFTRMMTDWHLGLTAFGRLSLSFSLTNFVLAFIGQVSMVVFPVLKRLDPAEQAGKYATIRLLLHTVLPITYLLYVPAKVVLGLWLPNYEASFVYLALTMPLCVYSCKANLLFNTYMKMGRHEGPLCALNVVAMVLNGALACVSIMGFASVEFATCAIVLTVALRDLAFELFMAKKFDNRVLGICASEAAVSAGFMAASWFLGTWSWPVVLLMLAVYLWFDREGVRLIVSEAKKRFSRA